MSLNLGSAISSISASGDIHTNGSIYAKSFNPTGGVLHLRVEEIENGMLMHLGFREGEVAKRIFVRDLSEMADILVAQIAADRMENGGK